jgi:hypothetical protein
MSWEGYYQCICKKGHYFVAAPNYGFDDDEACAHCESPAVFTNVVDETNCDSVGEIPLEELAKFKIADAVTETCPHCANVKLIEPEHFRVPNEEERKHMRYWRPGYGGTPLMKLEEELKTKSDEPCDKFTGPSGQCSTCYWPAAEHAGLVPHPKDRGCVTFVGTNDEPFKWHAENS